MMKRNPKKTEILQVRVPHGLKRDFMDRCRQEDRVASDVVRDFLESYLARPVEILNSEKAIMIRRRFIYPTLAAASLVGAVVAFMPFASQASTLREEFITADADKDGHLLAAEWSSAIQRPDAPTIVLTRDVMTFSRNPTKPPPAGERVETTRKLEAGDFAGNLVAESDTDHDGKVSFSEYSTFRVRMAEALFLRADTDHDDRMTRAEFLGAMLPRRAPQGKGLDDMIRKMRAGMEAQFDKMDAAGAGYLTREAYIPA